MRIHLRLTTVALVAAGCLFLAGCQKNWSETGTGPVKIVSTREAKPSRYSTSSGIKLVFDKGFAFKDLNRNGKLDPYEDWRLSADERAKDLASKMSIEQIAGLMLYSAHQAIPAAGADSLPPTTASRLPKAARRPRTLPTARKISDEGQPAAYSDHLGRKPRGRRPVEQQRAGPVRRPGPGHSSQQQLRSPAPHGCRCRIQRRFRRDRFPCGPVRWEWPPRSTRVWSERFGRDRGPRIPRTGHHDGAVAPDRPGHRTALEPCERHVRRKSPAFGGHGQSLCRRIPDLRQATRRFRTDGATRA